MNLTFPTEVAKSVSESVMVGGSVPGIASPVGAVQMFFVSVSVSALKEHSMEF